MYIVYTCLLKHVDIDLDLRSIIMSVHTEIIISLLNVFCQLYINRQEIYPHDEQIHFFDIRMIM